MANKTITFYSIIPIFNYSILSEEFTHSGTYRDASFLISFKRIASGKEGFSELAKNADKSIHENLASIHISPRFIFAPATNDFLFIEVTYPYNQKYEVSGNTSDTQIITHYILTALRLHSSKGILSHYIYTFRNPPNPHLGWNVQIQSPLMPQYSIGHLKGVSVLKKSDYANCRNTFERLLKNHSGNKSIDKILKLALDYHLTTFNLQTIEHSFLILIVIFEILFKKELCGNAEKAADRISKLISSNPSEQSRIKETFFKIGKRDSFCNIRNDIAHGNSSLNTNEVEIKFPILYDYITQAIIELIAISDSEIDKSKDYYDELEIYLNNFGQKRCKTGDKK